MRTKKDAQRSLDMVSGYGHASPTAWGALVAVLHDLVDRLPDDEAPDGGLTAVADIMRDIKQHAGHATFEGGDFPVYAVPMYVVEEEIAAHLDRARR